MKQNYSGFCLALIFMLLFSCFAQAQIGPVKAWDKTIGGDNDDMFSTLQQTSDGGYILGGASISGISGDKTQASKGWQDYWIVKLDAGGNKQWDNTIGGSSGDDLRSIHQTTDGGYILGGHSDSDISGDKTQNSRGSADFWVVKLDANGTKVWDKTFGGIWGDFLIVVQQTSDGGYILGGHSDSGLSGDKTQPSRGSSDYWVIRLDANGNKIWDKTLGGTGMEFFETLQQTSDGGFILGGTSWSGMGGDKTEGTFGNGDYWIVKLNANGNKVWDKTYGGGNSELFASLQQTSDNGYILGGRSLSGLSGNKTQGNRGGWDYWVVRIDSVGNILWDKNYGGYLADNLTVVKETYDGGYILGGTSHSDISFDKSAVVQGINDYWLVKLDYKGNKQWDKTYGGNKTDELYALQQTKDGGYILGGLTNSDATGDKTEASKGARDFWIIKLNPNCNDLDASLLASCSSGGNNVIVEIAGFLPGPSGNPFWSLTYSVNGVNQTITGSKPFVVLQQNAASGSVYNLLSLTSGNCSASLTGSLTVQPLPAAPAVQAGTNCGPGTVTLVATGAPAGFSYGWFSAPAGGTPLFTNPSGTFTTPYLTATTTYYVAVITNDGCMGDRAPVTATISSLVVNAGANETICPDNNPKQLTGFGPAGGTWTGPGVNATGVFTPTSNLIGTHTLTYTVSANGCTDSASKQVTVMPDLQVTLGPDINTCGNQPVKLQNLKAAEFAGKYVWSTGDTTASILVSTSGQYWVTGTYNGCTASDDVHISFNNASFDLYIYPNPNPGKFTIEFTCLASSEVDIAIFDMVGRLVWQKIVPAPENQFVEELTLPDVANGMYVLQARSGKQALTQKIVIQK